MTACKKNKPFDVDVSKVDVSLNITRFDIEQQQLDELNYNKIMREWREKYPLLIEVFVEQISRAGIFSDTSYYSNLKPLIFDRYTQQLYDEVLAKYKNINKISSELENAFRHIKYYFPDYQLPQIFTIVSNFGLSSATYENLLLISLDMYLGSDYPYYDGLFPKYKYKYFTKNQIVPDAMRVWFMKMFPEDSFSNKSLLSKMVYHGKKMLFLEMMLPGIADTTNYMYSEKELEWAQKYEAELWNILVENKVLFANDALKVSRYIDEAPFTNAYNFPQECPPRIGQWFGLQIIKSYLKNNKEINAVDIFTEKDELKILRLSGYKP